jgi:hypothetical protein
VKEECTVGDRGSCEAPWPLSDGRGAEWSMEHIVHIIIDLHPCPDLIQFLHDGNYTFTALFGQVSNKQLDIVIVALLNHLFGKTHDLGFQLHRFGQRRTGIPARLLASKRLK